MASSIDGRIININLKDYVELVDWAGKSIVHPNKAKMPAHINSLLSAMNLQPDSWLTQIQNFHKGTPHSIGCLAKLQERAKALKKKWLKGITTSKMLYIHP